MISLKQIAQDCLGISGGISVNRDIYGYIFRDGSNRLFGLLQSGDTLPASGQPTSRSLRAHLQSIQGLSINLSIFLVDHENDFSGAVSLDDVTKIQYAIQVTRDIYAQASLGVRKLYWRRIGAAEAGNYTIITNGAEATDLTDDFSGPNDGIDVFWVQSVLNAGGFSNSDGPCDKDEKDERTGAVLEVSGSRRFTGVLLAHEVGHYLGLGTGPGIGNLMGTDPDGDGIDSINSNSTSITNAQANTMRSGCWVRAAC